MVDVGSGAGLPGLVLAIARPDLRIDLVEPLARRVQFLTEAVSLLGLDGQVRVVRGRAEERQVIDMVGQSSWVTARAVAPLDRLVGWCLPLLSLGGKIVALKGSQAESELVEHRQTVGKLGGINPRVVQCGVGVVEPPVTVVVIERGPAARRVKGK
ncbi:MAG: gidB [Jatrophihabitans sp.]|nr:gidB [Jatrophihabitans sp.]